MHNHTVLTCTTECTAGVVAALGLIRNLPRSTVEMQMSGDSAGLNSYQVTPNSWTRKKIDGSSMESMRGSNWRFIINFSVKWKRL